MPFRTSNNFQFPSFFSSLSCFIFILRGYQVAEGLADEVRLARFKFDYIHGHFVSAPFSRGRLSVWIPDSGADAPNQQVSHDSADFEARKETISRAN